jgi:hypothetical protein
MLETEIPRKRWVAFCEEFSRQHQGWLVEVFVVEAGATPEAAVIDGAPELAESRDARLRRLACRQQGETAIVLVVSGRGDRQTEHRTEGPTRIVFEQEDDGAHAGVRIETAAGGTLAVRFRTPAHPEVLDGLSEAEQQRLV